MNAQSGNPRQQADAVEFTVENGIRDLWYPVLASWQLGATPFGVTRLGDRIVLWRDKSGEVRAVEDRCPHRGARLSLGCNLGDRIACWYHGVEVDAEGCVAAVPAVEKAPMTGRKMLRSYPAIEAQGAIFLWFGEAEPTPLQLPEQLTSEAFSGFLCTATWRCNYRYAHDNLMDLMHGAYLHAVSHSMSGGNKQAKMQLRETEIGFVYEKIDQVGENFDWVEFGDTGVHWMRTTVPYGPGAGPGGPFWIVGMVAPITPDLCQVFFWRLRHVQGWQRDSWRFLYRNRLEGRHWAVLEQDRRILEALVPNARAQETLYEHDLGVVRLRRALTTSAKREITARNPSAVKA